MTYKPSCRNMWVSIHPSQYCGWVGPRYQSLPDSRRPLMGNGDLAVAVGGTETDQTFYLSKSDLSHSTRGLGGLTVAFEGTAGDGAKYRQEQDLYRSEIRSVIPFAKTTVRMLSWTADAGNVLVTELWTEEGAPITVNLKLWSHPRGASTQAFTENGIIGSTREVNTKMGTTASAV